jgi:hypothetical protein
VPHRPFVRTALVAGFAVALEASSPASAFDVLTYHYDNLRTGWNSQEQSLTPASVAGSSFGVLASATVDARIDAQPLLVTGVNVANQGTHDVVYVATEKDSVFGFDATTGQQLLYRHLGTPPPVPLNPHNYLVGIMSTPVIDAATQTMYVVTLTYEKSVSTFRMHALALSSLADVVPSVVIAASDQLVDGTTVNFQAWPQLQRPGLLEANGNIYAAFGTWGDVEEHVARGWVMGFQAGTLTPLAVNELTNHRSTSPGNCWLKGAGPCFLSGVWMSGYGVAADPAGDLFFATGNSDSGTYDGVTNIQESVVNLSADLSTIQDLFTPWNVDQFDLHDQDLASGGVMLLPPQSGAYPDLAVAAGKPGTLYLMNRDSLGGHTLHKPDNVVGTVSIGHCWCGPSYFQGADGLGRVVSSGGQNLEVWRLQTNPTTALVLESTSAPLTSGQDAGFLSSVSSNGETPQTAIVWAVGRPVTKAGSLTFYAFNAADGSTLYSASMGSWPTGGLSANANLVPIVANGKVYVGEGRQFVILGLCAEKGRKVLPVADDADEDYRPPGHEIYGKVVGYSNAIITLRTRTGKVLLVDETEAVKNDHRALPLIGRALVIDGTYTSDGSMQATSTFRAKDSPALWLSDK